MNLVPSPHLPATGEPCALVCAALFNTPCFIFIFLPTVLIAYWLAANRYWRLSVISVSGFIFYSFWDVRFTLLLLSAAVVDFIIGIRMGASKKKSFWLGVSLVFNLGLLAFFKYSMFAAENARALLSLFGSSARLPYFSIVLPIGISFFTFKTLSYTIDVYRGDTPPTRNFLKYLAFISLFPELVAGPIVRWRELQHQLDVMPRRPPSSYFALGATFFILGLFKKVVLADSIARLIEPYSAIHAPTTVGAWIAALGYTLQLYFDFSGYSDMAIGLGALLGFRFPINFRAPYQALNPSDFWHRWHISLSRWLRDYLYISLGGNRLGERRTLMNLLLVMVLGGLWHGAAWVFILWGTYHGLLLIFYRYTASRWDAAPQSLQRATMLLLAVFGWVIFRAPDLSSAGRMLIAMLKPVSPGGWLLAGPALGVFAAMAWFITYPARRPNPAWTLISAFAVSLIPLGWLTLALHLHAFSALAVLFAFVWFVRPTTERQYRFTFSHAAILGAAMAAAIVFLGSGPSPFLYYQF